MTEVQIPAGRAVLSGNLTIPENAIALVLFAHGSGSSRHSPRNQFVARTLNRAGLGTLLFDLLTPEEEALDIHTREHRFNIGLLAERLVHATKWARQQEETRDLRIGYFGSSTGGAAALVAAAEIPQDVGAVVSRGGRPDLAGDALPRVQAPTLLIVGGNDDIVIELNEMARDQMRCEVKLEIIPGATHLFEEPGALEQVAKLASDWFSLHLSARAGHSDRELANPMNAGAICEPSSRNSVRSRPGPGVGLLRRTQSLDARQLLIHTIWRPRSAEP